MEIDSTNPSNKPWADFEERDILSNYIISEECSGCDKNTNCYIAESAIMSRPLEWVIIYEPSGKIKGFCKKRRLSA